MTPSASFPESSTTLCNQRSKLVFQISWSKEEVANRFLKVIRGVDPAEFDVTSGDSFVNTARCPLWVYLPVITFSTEKELFSRKGYDWEVHPVITFSTEKELFSIDRVSYVYIYGGDNRLRDHSQTSGRSASSRSASSSIRHHLKSSAGSELNGFFELKTLTISSSHVLSSGLMLYEGVR